MAFIDLTADGGHQPPGREPLTLAYLAENGGLLERIERIPKSRRETLVTLHRQAFETSAAMMAPKRAARKFIRHVRPYNRRCREAAAGPGADAAAVRRP